MVLVVAVHRDAHGAPHRQLDVVEDDRGRQLQQQPVRQALHVVGARDRLMRTANSSPPRRTARSPSRRHGAAGAELRQHLVAGVVPQRVVDALEVVDVEHQQGRGPAVAHRRRPASISPRSTSSERVPSEVSRSSMAER